MNIFTTTVWSPLAQDHVSVEVEWQTQDVGVMGRKLRPVILGVKDSNGQDLLGELEGDDLAALMDKVREQREWEIERARYEM